MVSVPASWYMCFEISGKPGRDSRAIVLVNELVRELQAVVDIETMAEQGVNRILVLIGNTFRSHRSRFRITMGWS